MSSPNLKVSTGKGEDSRRALGAVSWKQILARRRSSGRNGAKTVKFARKNPADDADG